MKKLLSFLIIALLFSYACKEEDNIHQFDGPSYVHFQNEGGSTYFVFEQDDKGFNVPIAVTQSSNESRTFEVEIDAENSSAKEGVDFETLNPTVTLPANEYVANIQLKGIFENLDVPKTLVLKLKDSGNNASFYQTYEVTITKFCPYIQSDMAGIYEFTSEAFGDTWDVELVAGSADNELVAKDLYEDGKDVIITLNDSDPSNFTATVAKQGAWTDSTYGLASVAGSGEFSACDKTITVALAHTVAAGSFGTYTESFVKK